MRTRYRFSHQGSHRYYWESTSTIGLRDSRSELVSADTMWYWGNRFDGTQWVHANGEPLSFDEVEALGYDGTLQRVPDQLLCLRCGAPLHYVATFGAPGHGQMWECENRHEMVKLGATIIDPNAIPVDEVPPWILSEKDVI